MNVAIVGCRRFTDYDAIESYLIEWEKKHGNIDLVISGGAEGVDTIAYEFAIKHNKKYIILKAEWNKYSKEKGKNRAGLIRNTDIVNQCDRIIAFPSEYSVGTYDTINKGYAFKKIMTIVDIRNNKICKNRIKRKRNDDTSTTGIKKRKLTTEDRAIMGYKKSKRKGFYIDPKGNCFRFGHKQRDHTVSVLYLKGSSLEFMDIRLVNKITGFFDEEEKEEKDNTVEKKNVVNPIDSYFKIK